MLAWNPPPRMSALPAPLPSGPAPPLPSSGDPPPLWNALLPLHGPALAPCPAPPLPDDPAPSSPWNPVPPLPGPAPAPLPLSPVFPWMLIAKLGYPQSIPHCKDYRKKIIMTETTS
ncbi:hypothetical protein L208DRAFT_1516359 [Tricholoma matsutake]|nr:hypothetical protein L208DRAFT_1516359 [Tricholoma matsutake 945]